MYCTPHLHTQSDSNGDLYRMDSKEHLSRFPCSKHDLYGKDRSFARIARHAALVLHLL